MKIQEKAPQKLNETMARMFGRHLIAFVSRIKPPTGW